MHNYSVNKYFGHFWQSWRVLAESEDDAWDRAEKDGHLEYQSVYNQPRDTESKGYVVDLDKKIEQEPPIDTDTYKRWLGEAIKKGMIVDPKEFEMVFGLPFHNIH